MFKQIAIAALVATMAAGAQAQTLPKKGSITGKFGWYAIGKTWELEPGHVVFTGEFGGTFFNDKAGGPFDNLAVSCPGINDLIFNGKPDSAASGYCINQDAAGDKMFSKWHNAGIAGGKYEGTFDWTGGTGKYAGIKGRNTFQCWLTLPTNSGYCNWQVNYELP